MIELYLSHHDVVDPFTLVVGGTAYACTEEKVLCRIGKVRRRSGHIYCAVNGMSWLNCDEWGELVNIDDYPALAKVARDL